MTQLINRSLSLNLFQILFSTLKIFVSVFVLMLYQKRCNADLDLWIMLMMSNDTLHICSLIMSIYYTTRVEERNAPRGDRGSNISDQNQQNGGSFGGEHRSSQDIERREEMGNYDRLENFEEENKLYFWFNEFVKM